MTTRPELDLGPHLLPGLAAVALFAVLAGAVVATPLGAQAGFPGPTLNETNVTAAVADGGTLVEGSGSYETSFDGSKTTVTVTLDDGTTFEERLAAEDVTAERVGDTTYATATVSGNGTTVTLARVAVVDHTNASLGPGAQVTGVNRSATAGGDAGIYAVARRGTITENVGYAMFDLRSVQPLPAEGFLVVFETIDLVLVAALVAAVMLARRDPDDEPRTALETEDDGGED